MNAGAKATLGIAAVILAAAIFPLLAVIVGFILIGMALHSHLSTPTDEVPHVSDKTRNNDPKHVTHQDVLRRLDRPTARLRDGRERD